MNYHEISIFTRTEGIEPVSGLILSLGISGFTTEDRVDFERFLNSNELYYDYIDEEVMKLRDCPTVLKVYLPDNDSGADLNRQLREGLTALLSGEDRELFGDLYITEKSVCEEDWANNWKQYFKPFTVGDKLYIKPSWEKLSDNEGRAVLEIDPASSFGTGTHHTTQLCMEALERYIRPGNRVLDMGCGSGILSIAALLLGAGTAIGVDIEESAVATAVENAKKNGFCSDRFTGLFGNALLDNALLETLTAKKYDIITANIVADVIKAFAPTFARLLEFDGILIVSGIISEREHEVKNTLRQAGFEPISCDVKNDWACVTLKRV